MTIQANDLGWMLRDHTNVVRGPFTHAEVLNLIKKGQLKGKSEVARANSYWFSIEEKNEVARFFPELGGGKPAEETEQPTQMTATLTQADLEGQGVEITQFTAAPSRAELLQQQKPKAEASAGEEPVQAQWLNDEFAEEFGAELESMTSSVQIEEGTGSDFSESRTPEMREIPEAEPTPEQIAQQKARDEMLSRATVKADTLPQERKNTTGDRPRPITAFLKPERAAVTASAPKISVPVENPEQARMLMEEEPRRRNFLPLIIMGAVVVVIGVAGGIWQLNKGGDGKVVSRPTVKPAAELENALRRSLLLFDLEDSKDALAEMEIQSGFRGRPLLPLAQALVKKEFLSDTDGASTSLQTARTLADGELAQEIENLQAAYGYDRDPVAAEALLTKLVAANPAEAVFRYNLALAQLRGGRPRDAITTLDPLFGAASTRADVMLADAAVLLGWARDLASKGADTAAENAYLKALELQPSSPKGRLGLAIHRLRRHGIKAAENDFRAFVESMPEFDTPSRAPQFRKMSDFDFYRFARAQLAELNVPVPGGPVGNRPSALAMAADGIVASLLSQAGEAKNIFTDAARAAPGDSFVVKAMGYLMWKEGKLAEIVDLLRDRERSSYAVNLLLGRAQLKLGRTDVAAKHFEGMTLANPARSDGWAWLGDIQLAQGKTDAAAGNFQEALRRDPLDLTALRGLNRMKRGEEALAGLPKLLPF